MGSLINCTTYTAVIFGCFIRNTSLAASVNHDRYFAMALGPTATFGAHDVLVFHNY